MFLLTCYVLLIIHCCLSHGSKPNIVVLMADDLGMGDVGVLGNSTIRTPNIDALARDGLLLTHHLAASSVCTPSRAAFLTSRYPIRLGLTPSNVVRVITYVASSGGLPQNETTLPEILKQSGYNTGLIGKWHLGQSCESKNDFCHHPLKHGFDYFYGVPLTNLKDFIEGHGSVVTADQPNIFYVFYFTYLSIALTTYVVTRNKLVSAGTALIIASLLLLVVSGIFFILTHVMFLNSSIMRNYDMVEQPIRFENMSKRIVTEAKKFIFEQARQNVPFFLFVSFLQAHTALHSMKEFTGRSAHGRYGDNVEEMDWCVGEIVKTLAGIGLGENTMVYFTSDNGGHVEERGLDGQREGGHNGIFRGGKTQGGMEGGVRVPTIIKWPSVVKQGRVSGEVTSMMDIFPTIADIVDAKMPTDRAIDGKSLLPLLKQETDKSPHTVLFHYCGTSMHAARIVLPDVGKVYKVHYATPNWLPGTQECYYVCRCDDVAWHDPPLIYELNSDPAEKLPLRLDGKAEVRDALQRISEERMKHEQSLSPVPNQMSWGQLMWKPWLQPCCNFPTCSCVDNTFRDLSEL